MTAKCDLCDQDITSAPFTIVTHKYRIENVCGECMNLYANHDFDALWKRMEELNDIFMSED